MYQAPMSLKEIIVNRLRNYFFLNIMQHPKTKNLKRKVKSFEQCVSVFRFLFYRQIPSASRVCRFSPELSSSLRSIVSPRFSIC